MAVAVFLVMVAVTVTDLAAAKPSLRHLVGRHRGGMHGDHDQRREKRSDADDVASLRAVVEQQARTVDSLQEQVRALRGSAALEKAARESLAGLLQSTRAQLASQAFTLAEMNGTAVSTHKAVAFSAQFIDGMKVSLGPPGSVVVFDLVTINISDGYDFLTGAFTAPVSGTYALSFRVRADGSHRGSATFALEKSGQVLTYTALHGELFPWDQSSTFVATHLNEGDSVVVKLSRGVSYVDRWYDTGFTGFLIAAD